MRWPSCTTNRAARRRVIRGLRDGNGNTCGNCHRLANPSCSSNCASEQSGARMEWHGLGTLRSLCGIDGGQSDREPRHLGKHPEHRQLHTKPWKCRVISQRVGGKCRERQKRVSWAVSYWRSLVRYIDRECHGGVWLTHNATDHGSRHLYLPSNLFHNRPSGECIQLARHVRHGHTAAPKFRGGRGWHGHQRAMHDADSSYLHILR